MTGKAAGGGFGLALTLARRELRGGLKGFRLFLACLALGVAAIAGVGSAELAVQRGLESDGRKILGGDVDLRLVHRPANGEQLAYLTSEGRISTTIEMRAMARAADSDDGRRQLVQLKAIDESYPLFGEMELANGGNVQDALTRRDGVYGALADAAVLDSLGLAPGDRIKAGEAIFVVRDVITREPDRSTRLFAFGPRLMISQTALDETELVQPGSLISYHYRLALPEATDVGAWVRDLDERFPDAGWRVRDTRNASPGLQSFIDRLSVYLVLVGLTALLVGGVGVAGAVRNYLDGKVETVATLKCLGAPNRLIFRTYLILVAIMAMGGIAIGLAIGAGLPAAVAPLIEAQLPVAARVGIYPEPLLKAAIFGLLTAIVFAIWPLARARSVPAGALFRNLVAPTQGKMARSDIVAIGLLGTVLALVVILTAGNVWLASWFVAGAIATLLIFRWAAQAIAALARRASKRQSFAKGRPGLRLAVANLHRPGAPVASIVLSLGIGLTVLVAVMLVQGNLSLQVNEEIPEQAPTFFFIDIQPDQVADFDTLVASHPGVSQLERVASLRGRITRLDGVPVENVAIAPGSQWATRNERGLTYAVDLPEGSTVVAGEWWPTDYGGPPLVSFDHELAAGMGLSVGDTMTINVLGREVTATIANLRRIDWATLGINFTLVFAPGTLEGAPQTHIATAVVAPEEETALMRAVTDRFANVSAIRVKDALEAVNQILGTIGDALQVIAGIALLAGALVLSGAVMAGHQRRVYDAVVLKVLGAQRRDVLRAFLLEYGLLGAATAVIGAVLGSIAAWAILTQVMGTEWVFLPEVVAGTGILCVIVTMVFGFAGTWRALSRKAAPLLRNE